MYLASLRHLGFAGVFDRQAAPPKRSIEDILFDYLDPEERRICNDLAWRIQMSFRELEGKKSVPRDHRSVKPLINSMQE